MAYKQKKQDPVSEGGTGTGSFTQYSVVCAGTTATGSFQSLPSIGQSFQVLTSQGAGALPEWAELDNETFFEVLATDPTDPANGQVWYNSTSHIFKGALTAVGGGTWVYKAQFPDRINNFSSFGTSNSATLAGGFNSAQSGNTNSVYLKTKYYDGGSNTWSAKSNLLTAINYRSSSGDTSQGLVCGGQAHNSVTPTNTVESYSVSGDTWSLGPVLLAAVRRARGSGPSNNALIFDGLGITTSQFVYNAQYFDGVSWSSKAPVNIYRDGQAQGGTMGTGGYALAAGGNSIIGQPGVYPQPEVYTLSTNVWVYVAQRNYYERNGLCGAAGTASSGVYLYGGAGAPYTYLGSVLTETYNGVSNVWTIYPNMNSTRQENSGTGDTMNALTVGFESFDTTSSISNITEQFTGASSVQIVDFDLS